MRLSNKTAIITGAAHGIGRQTAVTFAREGCRVVAVDLDAEAGGQLVQEIAGTGASALFVQANVAEAGDVQAMVEKAVDAFGTVDILVNNAGIVRDATLVKMEVAQWEQVLDINLKGVFLCGQAVARVMIRQASGGVVLNASSVVGLYGNFGQTNYVATKAGVIGMTRTWARELGKHGIRVNAVAPGFIATDLVKSIPDKVIQLMIGKTPLGRMGQAEDIANAYLFLASDEASFITGTVLSVDGGVIS